MQGVIMGRCQIWKVSDLEGVRIGRCQNLQSRELSETAQFAKHLKLLGLESVRMALKYSELLFRNYQNLF